MATKLAGFSEPAAPAWTICTACNSSLAQTAACGWQDPHHVRRAETGASPKEPAERIIRDIAKPYVCVCRRLGVSAFPSGNGHGGCFQSLAEFALGELQSLTKSQDFARPLGKTRIDFRSMRNPDSPAECLLWLTGIPFITPSEIKSQVLRSGALFRACAYSVSPSKSLILHRITGFPQN